MDPKRAPKVSRSDIDTYSKGTICIANDTFSADSDESQASTTPLFTRGEILTIIQYMPEDNMCSVVGPDGAQSCVPMSYLKIRPPVTFHPLPYLHKDVKQSDTDQLLVKEKQFIVTPQNIDDYCIYQRISDVVKVFVITTDMNRQLTIDGVECFTSLPALISFYQNIEEISSNGLVPMLGEPVPVSDLNDCVEFIDRDMLINNWSLPFDSIEKTKVIGKGEFGEVYSGRYCDKYQVAVKTLSSSISDTDRDSLMKEALIMTHLRHSNLVPLVGVIFDEANNLQMIAMELMSRGSLGKYLITRGRSVVSQKEQIQYARDICSGMVYFSSHGFVHRDLAARNVLLNENGVAKVSDFGLSRRADVHIPHEVGKFPVKWTAPEALKDRIFSEKSDVWSFGILLWEIFAFGRTPYPSIPNDEVLDQLEDGYLMDPPEGCIDAIYDIMTECWAFEPNGRPTFETVQKMLSSSFGESRTPCSSPKPARTAFAKVKNQAQELLNNVIATDIYQRIVSAPDKVETTLNTANVIVVGLPGAGKTSLIRRMKGEQFRLAEKATKDVLFPEQLCEVSNHNPWKESTDGISYNNELARCVAKQLLEQVKESSPFSLSSPSHMQPHPLSNVHPLHQPLPPPPSLQTLPPVPFNKPLPTFNLPDHLAPPLPIPDRRRSASFSYRPVTIPARNNMSMVIEDMSFNPLPAISFSGSQPDGLNRTPPSSPPTSRKRSIKRTLSFNMFRRPLSKRKQKTPHQNSSSSSLLSPEHTTANMERKESPLLSSRSVHSPPTETPTLSSPPLSPPTSPPFHSSIPSQIADKIRNKLNDCVNDSGLPPEVYVRLIDTPGHLSDSVTISSLITSSTIILAVLDVSKNDQAAIDQLVARVNTLLCGTNDHSNDSQPAIILVGTHTDETTIHKAKEYITRAQGCLKEGSVCGKYVCSDIFLISSRLVMEQSSLESIKAFISKLVISRYSSSVPLKWLQSIVKLKSFSLRGQYLVSQDKIKASMEEIDDFEPFFSFLQSNHIVLNFRNVPTLKGIVFTDVKWIVEKLNGLLSLVHSSHIIPSHLSHDYDIITSQGSLSQSLLNYAWSDCSKSLQNELLFILHQFELLGLTNDMDSPISPCESQRSISTTPTNNPATPTPTPLISKIIIPCLVKDEIPDHIISSSTGSDHSCLESLHFEFSVPCIPSELLYKLITRCFHCYNSRDSMIFKNGACFAVDQSTTLFLHQSFSNVITINLHLTHRSPHPLFDTLPTADIAMATLMFIRVTLSDIVTTWFNNSMKFSVCVTCNAEGDTAHLAPLSDSQLEKCDSLFVHCKQSQHPLVKITKNALPWFGRDESDEAGCDSNEFVIKEDLLIIQSHDGLMFKTVSDFLTEKSSFFDLIKFLEDNGRHDIANILIDTRMRTTGVAL